LGRPAAMYAGRIQKCQCYQGVPQLLHWRQRKVCDMEKWIALMVAATVLSGCLAPAMLLTSSVHSVLNYTQLEDVKKRLDNIEKKE